MTTIYHAPGEQVYVRTLGGTGPVLRAVGTLQRLEVRHESLDATDWGGPQLYLTGPTTLDINVRCYGSDTRPTGDHLDLPLIERLALAVLDGDDTAVYPLIDEFLLTRNR